MPVVSVVLLTMGDRPELDAAVASVRAQRGVTTEVVIVANATPGEIPDRDLLLEPGRNLGIPAGRNLGLASASGELVCFLDDDATLLGPDVLARAVQVFERRPDVAVVALRVVGPDGSSQRRHHPGLRSDPAASGEVTSFPGGAAVVRREAFEAVGGFYNEYFYALEETDLAWRLIDEGWRVRYEAELAVLHPVTEPSRHPEFARRTARNRVWLARRLLPAPMAVLYVLDWASITLVRQIRSPSLLLGWAQGTVEGLRSRPGPRNPISWSTVLELTRLGRPPVV